MYAQEESHYINHGSIIMALTLKTLRNSVTYEELRAFVAVNNPANPAYELGLLARRVMHNCNENERRDFGLGTSIMDVFNWLDSPEGHEFWHYVYMTRVVDNMRPCPVGGAQVVAAKEKIELFFGNPLRPAGNRPQKVAPNPPAPPKEQPPKFGWWGD
jgi:hypothetical protein